MTKQNVFYIADDYIEHVAVAACSDYPEFWFKFRPMNILEAAKWADKTLEKMKSTEQLTQLNLEIVQVHMIDWSLTKPDGTKIDHKSITELCHLNPLVAGKIINTIRGEDSDVAAQQRTENAVKNS